MVYNTITEQYFGPNLSVRKKSDRLWIWVDDADNITPWLSDELESLLEVFDGCEKLEGIEMNNIIVVPIDAGGLNFTDSIPLTQWSN